MLVSLAARLAAPFGQVPNAHRSAGTAVRAPLTLSRTVRLELLVFVSAAGYAAKFAAPSNGNVNVPLSGMVRSEYSIRMRATIGLPSALTATGNVGTSRLLPGTRSPSQPASTIV